MNSLKKCVFGFSCICLMVLAMSGRVKAAVVDSGECGANVTWSYDDNGTLTIDGNGER